ncbi:MAG TPA: flagellar biosynthesis protein FliQ [Candidatus Desulfofervidus auxilii]|uniref:Flagellar biosynthetic protein FliQ n=1 Tax=Desulfofervidus auxilii TaxID=1621989 RepID=A0A7C0U3G3_DESA2|nr:flagellar biosynthesis protein FliQ [Candidatus Desulfofervidus auxilii]HDD44876.1 flagellar biosynthesis protein FliQ [Candidatus Desulfofervidus auxilii]
MTPEFVLGIGQETLKITLLISAPMLLAGLIAGVLVSLFQAVTQIHEMTLIFVPKILAVVVALIFFSPWMLRLMLDFTIRIFTQFPIYLG